MISDREVLEYLREPGGLLPPLSIRLLDSEVAYGPGRRVDAILEGCWGRKRYRFVVEARARSTPKVLRDAVAQVGLLAEPPKSYPMVVVPYLSSSQLGELEEKEISGIDLSGNGVVIVPGELLVLRTGTPNKFPQSSPIKKAYCGNSSLVARVFLLRGRYSAVGDIRKEILSRGAGVAISTVSKVLRRLEEDLIVGRKTGIIRLLQPDKLLEKLVDSYQPPKIRRRFLGKCRQDVDMLMKVLNDLAQSGDFRVAITGSCSARRYAVMGREDKYSIYCSRLAALLDELGTWLEESTTFPSIEFLETAEDCVYFDRRWTLGYSWASPVQTYLELATGDKRDRQSAEQVKRAIVDGLQDALGSPG